MTACTAAEVTALRGSVGAAPLLPRLLSLSMILLLLFGAACAKGADKGAQKAGTVTQAAAQSCAAKLDRLVAFEQNTRPDAPPLTEFTESEVNSYLALELSQLYHPCLKSLAFAFEEGKLRAVAAIDFDRLGMTSKDLATQLFAKMFSGVHSLTIHGSLIARDGKARFQLNEARFDNTSLPNILVEEIISAVGRRQDPPFDPLQPNEMPYSIRRVDVHPAHIKVYQ